jgi:thymidine kinase
MLAMIENVKVVIVDEAQFFRGLVPFAKHVVDFLGKKLYLLGLDGDSNREPFGEILDCIPLADKVYKLTAFCKVCADGTPAIFTKRLGEVSDQQVIIGGKDMYASVCRKCYLRQSPEESRA